MRDVSQQELSLISAYYRVKEENRQEEEQRRKVAQLAEQNRARNRQYRRR